MSGGTLQELEGMGAHSAQLRQGRGYKEEGGREEGRLFKGSEVISILEENGLFRIVLKTKHPDITPLP